MNTTDWVVDPISKLCKLRDTSARQFLFVHNVFRFLFIPLFRSCFRPFHDIVPTVCSFLWFRGVFGYILPFVLSRFIGMSLLFGSFHRFVRVVSFHNFVRCCCAVTSGWCRRGEPRGRPGTISEKAQKLRRRRRRGRPPRLSRFLSPTGWTRFVVVSVVVVLVLVLAAALAATAATAATAAAAVVFCCCNRRCCRCYELSRLFSHYRLKNPAHSSTIVPLASNGLASRH